ncbi:hypothetical protein ILUMI_23094 [Ignelater luminosus]|uniref:Protein sleepless n=1 Tax=Ignelater luminosus TaxID=2038154 RepID=A0A8K0G1Z5_IGNLU|nr:hypothetical protein ILUMI_23094 [Ignelater luminosus]
MLLYWKILVHLVTLTLLIECSLAIRCYQCSGTDNDSLFQCNEFLSKDVDLEPQSCDDVYGAKYCVKHTGRFEGGIGTKRFCSSLDLGNYCNFVKQPGDILNYRTCIYTCTGDGCNPSSKTYPLGIFSIVTIAGFTTLLRTCFT